MKSSVGKAAVSAFSTVSPPMPESNTPMGRSIATRAPRRFPFEAAIEFGRAGDFLRGVILSASEALADCSRSRRHRAKDMFVNAGRFHAQVGGNFSARFFETIRQRAVKSQAQRREGPETAVGREHVLAAEHWIIRKTAARGAAQPRSHPETAHADERDVLGRDNLEQLVDQQQVIA